jgi:hypothetical protein
MKKIIVLFAVLMLTAGVMQSQVKIGDNSDPTKGAVLDLNGTYKGGLLLPKVEITNMAQIPATFSDYSSVTPTNLEGLLVWNTYTGKEGVYRWNGTQWNPLTVGCSAAPSATSISGFSATYANNAEITVTCTATTTGVTFYLWTVPAGLSIVSGNGTSQITLKVTTGVNYKGSDIKCTVINACIDPANPVVASGTGTFSVS